MEGGKRKSEHIFLHCRKWGKKWRKGYRGREEEDREENAINNSFRLINHTQNTQK